MKHRLCALGHEALSQLPRHTDDRSGVGVHYVDAYLKLLNVTLEDGSAVKCRRRGLKVSLSIGARKGDGLLRRLENGPDPVAMLDAALQEAAAAAGVELAVESGVIYLTVPEA